MKIYTRTGDEGQTSLFGGGRVSKDHVRVAAYGDVDELNAVVGLAAAAEPSDFEAPLFEEVQNHLFSIGAQLASPEPAKVAKALKKAAISKESVGGLEAAIDRADAELDPMKAFVLPGGTWKGALLHFARTVCRRAERSVVALDEHEPVPPLVLAYLNRLSDLLFAYARLANSRARVNDRFW